MRMDPYLWYSSWSSWYLIIVTKLIIIITIRIIIVITISIDK